MIGNKCTELRYLNLASCRLLTDTSIEAITNHCVALETLNISKCKLLTDQSIISCNNNLSSLKSLWTNLNPLIRINTPIFIMPTRITII